MDSSPPLTPEQRQELEALYRQTISAVRSLARLLGKPCPIVSKQDRRSAQPCSTPAHPDH